MFLTCSNCGSYNNTSVIDTRENRDNVRRRRKCVACDFRWTTREITDAEYKSLKGDRERSSLENQIRTIVKAYVKTMSAKDQVEFFNEIIK